MYVAIDDTYGNVGEGSRYVTDRRRTSLAVAIPDSAVDEIRKFIRDQITLANETIFSSSPENRIKRFHFTDVYNRDAEWKILRKVPDPELSRVNLIVFEAFGDLYRNHPLGPFEVFIQTVDDRTEDQLKNTTLAPFLALGRDRVSLILVLSKLKAFLRKNPEPIRLFVDRGLGQPGTVVYPQLFKDWPSTYEGLFAASEDEPILQLADFLAFCINRSTYIGLKDKKTSFDLDFVQFVADMDIKSPDFKVAKLPPDFGVDEFDALHDSDRLAKGLPKLGSSGED